MPPRALSPYGIRSNMRTMPLPQPLDPRRGIANLLIVLMIGIFALTLSLVVASGVAGGFSKNHNTAASNDAFYTAEAAMREGMYQYERSSSTYAGGSFPLLNTVDSSTVTIVSDTWPYVDIVGAANGRGSYRTVTEHFTTFPEGLAFSHAIYAKYDLAIGGSATVNGNIFANGNITLSGSTEINGDAISSSTITQTGGGHGSDVTGAVVQGADPIPAPAIDIAPYIAAAQASSTYFSTSSDAEAYLKNIPRRAIVVVDDPTSRNGTNLQNQTDLTGSLVVNGDLTLTGGTYTATGTYAAVVVIGNLSVSGGTTIKGIVYVTGTTTFGAGNNTVVGSIISVGGVSAVSFSGKTTVTFDPTIAANWQNLTGLATTSIAVPEPVEWSED